MEDYRALSLEVLETRRLLAADIVISEFVASNQASLLDEDGDSSDWIEIYNAGLDNVNLANWHLTDNVERPSKWSFPPVELAAGKYLTVFASDKDRTVAGSPLHTNFKLDADGEYLALTRDDSDRGTLVVVAQFEPAYPTQFEDISFGFPQSVDGTISDSLRFFEVPSPGSQNPPNGKTAIRADPVLLSHPHGFYEDRFSLTLTTASPATVRYTLDGTEPTQFNGIIYRSPISIRETTTLRTRAFQPNVAPSPVTASTYLFLDDVVTQSSTGRAPSGFPSSRSINGQTLDYGMDPDIVDDDVWGPQLDAALTHISTMSLVMDVDDLLSSRDGIYTNANRHGREWERPASLELIHPDGSPGFQVSAGVRIRGGFSRSDNNPKHAFRFFFRDEWGDAKLEFPLFGDEGAQEFDKFDLRTAQNYSWSFRGDSRNTFLREVFARDLQRELSQPYTRSRYYHLYINGQYWGLYQSQERAEAKFAASYFGGDDEDYDVVKSAGGSGGHENEATDGNLDAYRRLADFFYQLGGLANASVYYRVQGQNPDGSRNPKYERLLDVDNLIDFAITTYFTGDRDGPVSRFVNGVNNYFAIYNREDPDGFKYFEHDSEHTLDVGFPDLAEQITSNGSQFRYFNPLWMHEQLIEANADYRLQFADRILELTKPGGMLSAEVTQRIIDQRMQEIDQAIIAESARWGDAKRDEPFTKDDWLDAVDSARAFLIDRGEVLVEQFRNLGWFPSVERPTVYVDGAVDTDSLISMSDDISLLAADDINYNQTLIAERSSWNYLDDGSDQGTDWRYREFDDSAWRSGRGQLGYGDGDESTRIQSGATNDKHITTYFRRTFNVSSPSSLDGLRLRLMRDDGAVVYLNGEEVVRSNMRPGEVTSKSRAAASTTGATESVYFRFNIDPTLLRSGENVIAVELHQVSGTTSDASFDLELLGGQTVNSSQTIYYTLDGSDPRLTDGSISDAAIRYSREFSIFNSATVSARSKVGTQWSPLRTVPLEVTDPPLQARADQIIVDENGSATSLVGGPTTVLANDIGLQNTPIRVTRVSSPQHSASFRLNEDGTFEYQHNGTEVFTDSFSYRVTDAKGKSDVGTVQIEIQNVSDTTPDAVEDEIWVREGLQTNTLANGRRSVLDNDSGLVDTPIEIRITRLPLHAQLFSFEDDGTFVYRHDGSETRSDSFAYAIEDNDGQIDIANVSVVVQPVSDASPSPRQDDILVNEGMTSAILVSGELSVLSNDLGIVDTPVLVTLRRAPQHASAFELREDGTFSYTHDGGLTREDSFTYQVLDVDGQAGTAVVNVQVTPVDSGPPEPVDDHITLPEGASTRRLTDGALSVLSNDGNLRDGPYEVLLATPPIAASQFSLKADGTLFYRHDGSEVHSDAFSYRVIDSDGDEAIGEVTIFITPVSDARPNARDDSVEVARGGATAKLTNGEASVLTNDTRLDDWPISLSLVTAPRYASSFVLNVDGTFQYFHNGSSQSSDRFVYRIEDNDGQTSLADVDIAIVALAGDFDVNGVVDLMDLNLLKQAVGNGRFESNFDLIPDRKLDGADLDWMIEGVLKTRYGDTNLDGDVDFSDFLDFSRSFGSTNANWEQGNFNLDDTVGFADFLRLSSNFGFRRHDEKELRR